MKAKYTTEYLNQLKEKRWLNEEGDLHRTKGPAYVRSDGYKTWYRNGSRHRTNGPAVIYPKDYGNLSGVQFWYLYGTKLTQKLFLKLTKGPVKKLPLYLGLGTGIDLFISERIKQHESGHL